MAHDHFFNSGMTLPKLRDSALADRLLPFMGESTQITGRSIAWKVHPGDGKVFLQLII
jgi:hypothetical protein